MWCRDLLCAPHEGRLVGIVCLRCMCACTGRLVSVDWQRLNSDLEFRFHYVVIEDVQTDDCYAVNDDFETFLCAVSLCSCILWFMFAVPSAGARHRVDLLLLHW